MKAQHQQQIVPQTCPVCNAPRKYLSYVPLVQKSIVHITCKKCSGNVLAFLSQNDVGTMTVGIVTDLSVDEAQKFMSSESVDFDEVLALHETSMRDGLTIKDLLQK